MHSSRLRTTSALVRGAVCVCLYMAAAAVAQVAPAGPSAEVRDVRTWLGRINDAASQRNYQGTFVVSGGGAVSSSRIAHFCEGPSQFERIESLDGKARQVYRHNDRVHTLWPASRFAVIEQRDPVTSFPALLQAGFDRVAESYSVHVQGMDRVAGHEAQVLQVRPRDAWRFGYRLWAEKDSGLLLRAEVLGERGEVIETSAFSEVTIGVRPQPEAVLQGMKRLDGYRVVRATLEPARLDAEGWTVQRAAPGFRMVSCIKRPIELDDGNQPAAQVLQTVFTDGLTHVSLFIEPFSEKRHARAFTASVGATHSLMQRKGDWWITVMGDVPAATLQAFADGLERKK
jgi:sigma-E factor negative regulatory protein RseB